MEIRLKVGYIGSVRGCEGEFTTWTGSVYLWSVWSEGKGLV